jgi:nucleoside 2-deoxyribosyltransferase
MKIYLAGPINGCTDSEATSWRYAVKQLHSDVLDPMVRDYRGRESDNIKEIVEGDKADIDSCDGMIVWFERPSVGTSMEVLYAYDRGIPVVVINRSFAAISPWLLYHSKCIVGSIPDALNILGASE